MKRLLWIGVILVAVAGLVLVVRLRVEQKQNAPRLRLAPTPVEVARVAGGDLKTLRHALGTVHDDDRVALSPRVMAKVLKVLVRQGDHVKKGQLLVVLDRRESTAVVAQARAGLAAAVARQRAAEAAYLVQRDATTRAEKLFHGKAIAQEQYDRARARRAATRAQKEATRAAVIAARRRISQSRTRLTYSRLVAPFDGLVSARLKDAGDLAVPGRPVLEIVRAGKIRVRVALPVVDFNALKVGRAVHVDFAGKRFSTAISRVFPAAGPDRMVSIEADISRPPAGLISGTPVGVDVEISAVKGMIVPADALLESRRGGFVFVVAGETVHPRRVEVLGRSRGSVALRGPLHPGELVVRGRPSGLMRLAEGTRVHVVAPPKPVRTSPRAR